jgi:hypothetical protein
MRRSRSRVGIVIDTMLCNWSATLGCVSAPPNSAGPGSTPRGGGPSGAPPDGPKRDASQSDGARFPFRGANIWWIILAAWAVFLAGQLWYESTQVAQVPYSRFLEYQQEGRVSDLVIGSQQITGRIVKPEEGQPERFRTVRVDPELAQQLAEGDLEFTGRVEDTWLGRLLVWMLPVAIIVTIWMFVLRRIAQGPGLGGGLMSVGKSKAKIYAEEDVKVTFDDVAGVEEAKAGLKQKRGFPLRGEWN